MVPDLKKLTWEGQIDDVSAVEQEVLMETAKCRGSKYAVSPVGGPSVDICSLDFATNLGLHCPLKILSSLCFVYLDPKVKVQIGLYLLLMLSVCLKLMLFCCPC